MPLRWSLNCPLHKFYKYSAPTAVYYLRAPLRIDFTILLFQKRAEQIYRQRQKRGRVVFAGHFAHGLQVAQLQRNRFLGDQGSGLHHFLGGLEFAFRVHNLRAAFAFGLGLFGHCTLHAVGQRHVLHLHRRDFDAPRFGLAINDFLQLLVNDVALRKQVVQRRLPQHAAQRRLRDKRSRFPEILHLHHGVHWIDDAEINHGVHRGRHVVAGHDFLLGNVNGHDAQIHPHHFVYDGNKENQSRPFRALQFAEPENDTAFVFAQNPHGLGQHDDRQDHDNDYKWGRCAKYSLKQINEFVHIFLRYGFLGFTFNVNPSMSVTSTGCPASTGVSLTAFQVSPSINTLPPCESIRESALTVRPSIVSLPAWTGLNCARIPLPTTNTKNAAVTSVAGMIQDSGNPKAGPMWLNSIIAPRKKATMPPAVSTPCVGEKTSTMNNAIASPINTNPVTLTGRMDDM